MEGRELINYDECCRHPKVDPVTNELLCFAYEAKGDGTPDVCYYSISPNGKFREIVWLVSPVVAMIHDFAVTDNWVYTPFLVIPLPMIFYLMSKLAGIIPLDPTDV